MRKGLAFRSATEVIIPTVTPIGTAAAACIGFRDIGARIIAGSMAAMSGVVTAIGTVIMAVGAFASTRRDLAQQERAASI